VELKTKKADEKVGSYIEIENSVVLKQEPCAFTNGTSISMKNLFFNLPARRNFLKSNSVETRHIVDEFIRVAMAFPNIFFSLTSNGQEVFHLESGNLKQRIVQILGNNYNAKLVPVKEETDYLNVYGFIGKPDTAKKTRGDQYFFVNNRFIKSAYLNHAVNTAYNDLLPKDSFPSYVLFIDLDPEQIDINVHPTKQEIKFEDEKITYAFVQSAVKHALAQFSVAPSLDFTLNANIQSLSSVSKPFTEERKDEVSSSNLYKTFTQKNQAHFIERSANSELKHWREFFTPSANSGIGNQEFGVGKNELTEQQTTPNAKHQTNNYEKQETRNGEQITPNSKLQTMDNGQWAIEDGRLTQLHNTYIISSTPKGFMLIHQQLAHERVLYEKYSKEAHHQQAVTQKSLFPVTLELGAADAVLLEDLLDDINALGYQIEHFGNNTFVIQGTPADVLQGNEKNSIELLLEQFKHSSSDIKFSKREKLIRCLTRQNAIKAGQPLSQKEMQTLIEDLFKCQTPNTTATGNPTFVEFKEDYLDRMFTKW
jgi:DNA mismatch repair protein MutL